MTVRVLLDTAEIEAWGCSGQGRVTEPSSVSRFRRIRLVVGYGAVVGRDGRVVRGTGGFVRLQRQRS